MMDFWIFTTHKADVFLLNEYMYNLEANNRISD